MSECEKRRERQRELEREKGGWVVIAYIWGEWTEYMLILGHAIIHWTCYLSKPPLLDYIKKLIHMDQSDYAKLIWTVQG